MIILEDMLSTEPQHSQLNPDSQISTRFHLEAQTWESGMKEFDFCSVAYKFDFIPITLHFIILKTGIIVPRQSRCEVTVTCYTECLAHMGAKQMTASITADIGRHYWRNEQQNNPSFKS